MEGRGVGGRGEAKETETGVSAAELPLPLFSWRQAKLGPSAGPLMMQCCQVADF